MHLKASALALCVAVVACSPPSPQPQPNEIDQVVNATRYDQAAPEGALGNEAGNYGAGSTTPAERGSIYNTADGAAGGPAQVVVNFGTALQQRQFDQALSLWAPGATSVQPEALAQHFEPYQTIEAAVGTIVPSQGVSGEQQNEVQLTLSGTRGGENYVLTGPVTVRNVGQGDAEVWRIVKMVLTSNAQAAEQVTRS